VHSQWATGERVGWPLSVPPKYGLSRSEVVVKSSRVGEWSVEDFGFSVNSVKDRDQQCLWYWREVEGSSARGRALSRPESSTKERQRGRTTGTARSRRLIGGLERYCSASPLTGSLRGYHCHPRAEPFPCDCAAGYFHCRPKQFRSPDLARASGPTSLRNLSPSHRFTQ
jgi:hypothetical protein